MQPQVKIIKAQKDNSNPFKLANKARVCAYCRVSTDVEEQLLSFESQKQYYKDKISENESWEFVDIYADEAVTGTKASVREGFLRMINDCMAGKIDIIMTKSISRFARNTIDTLHYVRKLKEKNVAVIFEEEHINTLAMEGELLLTILSSVAQQEVSNTSAHVKKGLKMKLERGELIGFNGCIGFNYDPIKKQITVNEDEAKIVRYIFNRYADGFGASVICKELESMNIKTRRGHDKWSTTVITGIIRNEKYVGDCLFGKTYTVDPIEKKRVPNKGQYDMVYMENHHEAIVDKETFRKANEYLDARSRGRKQQFEGPFLDFKGKFAFSKKIRCGFCGATYARRQHHQTSTTLKATWKCMTTTKSGAVFCPDSDIVDEKTIMDAFVLIMKRLVKADDKLIGTFIDRTKASIEATKPTKSLTNINQGIKALEARKNQLMDLMLDGTISKEQYQIKVMEADEKIKGYQEEIKSIEALVEKQKNYELKLTGLTSLISTNMEITEFDQDVFEALFKNVIVGGMDGEVKNSHMLTFVFSDDRATEGNNSMKYIVFDRFDMDVNFYEFVKNEFGVNKKRFINSIPIRLAIETKE